MATQIEKPKLIMDGHKLNWHLDRVAQWNRGERIAPILIDMALTKGCDAKCTFCYAWMQKNRGKAITETVMDNFMDDCERMGVRAVSLLSDGESVLSPVYVHTIKAAAEHGIPIASGSNCHRLTPDKQEEVLKHLSYVRINFPAGTKDRYCEIMQVPGSFYEETSDNVRSMVAIKKRDDLDVTIGLQMVLMPQDADQIIPFVKKAKEFGVDYAVIKHCADDEDGYLGVDYSKYKDLIPVLEEAEGLAEEGFGVHAMWSKMLMGAERTYERCYGPPFLIQISGSGVVAPCGDKFATKYAEQFHIGNICEDRWYDIWQSERYWEVMDYLKGGEFNPQTACGPLCRQHKINEALDAHERGIVPLRASEDIPQHVNFL